MILTVSQISNQSSVKIKMVVDSVKKKVDLLWTKICINIYDNIRIKSIKD